MSMMKNTALLILSALLSFSNALAQPRYSMEIRNAQAETVETEVGKGPILRLCGGIIPSSIDRPDGGESFAMFQLPEDWLTAPTNAFVVKVGQWKSIATGTGRPTHYRLYSSDGTTQLQGPVSTNSGNGVVTLGNMDLVEGTPVFINSFILGE